MLEYGNAAAAKGSANKCSYTTFVCIARAENCADGAIARVDFNINPGYDRPTESVTEPKRGGRFEFEYAMSRTFPCVTTVHFKPDIGSPPLVLEYVVQRPEGAADGAKPMRCARRVVLQLPAPKGAAGGAKPKPLKFAAHPPRNGWVRLDQGGKKPEVSYHAQPCVDMSDGTWEYD